MYERSLRTSDVFSAVISVVWWPQENGLSYGTMLDYKSFNSHFMKFDLNDQIQFNTNIYGIWFMIPYFLPQRMTFDIELN